MLPELLAIFLRRNKISADGMLRLLLRFGIKCVVFKPSERPMTKGFGLATLQISAKKRWRVLLQAMNRPQNS
jgi:hypothetical protein